MSVSQAEVHEAIRGLDVPDDTASRAAIASSAAPTKVEDETAKTFDKRDADIEAIRKDMTGINKETAGIDRRLTTVTGETDLVKWMMGAVLAMLVPSSSALSRIRDRRRRRVGEPPTGQTLHRREKLLPISATDCHGHAR